MSRKVSLDKDDDDTQNIMTKCLVLHYFSIDVSDATESIRVKLRKDC